MPITSTLLIPIDTWSRRHASSKCIFKQRGAILKRYLRFSNNWEEQVRRGKTTYIVKRYVCGRLGDEPSGRQVHGNAIKIGVESDRFVECCLVDMYGKRGLVKDARKVFEMTKGHPVQEEKKRCVGNLECHANYAEWILQ
ncbi:hypothetical protein IFM89_029291 [Coptis chinensis]|uniref:Pentatricopeptide repeat-containing protein n=1 Tax=Coptis chinensis TaxID=261450 RepID=A0A835LXI9_9MAGN|nr:hypothetical protein IFM89_029291 [Coptis chinensis]